MIGEDKMNNDNNTSDILGSIDIDTSQFSKKSPFAKKEKTHPIRIRDSQYEKIRLIAFKKKKKMIDVLDELLQNAIDEEESNL
jgi:hypothetical protein